MDVDPETHLATRIAPVAEIQAVSTATVTHRRYVSDDEDSGHWDRLAFHHGDVVVSSRSKHGTTWLQTVVLLLIHQSPDLPVPLAQLSPWLDHRAEPLDTVISRLAAQRHRRVIKTHTPLDGVPIHPSVTYLVIARHPLDAAVSLYHQGANIDRGRLRQFTGARPPAEVSEPPPIHEWLTEWIDTDADAHRALDSLPGVLWHLTDAWSRRHDPNVLLIHYDDLLADLDGQMRALSERLGITVVAERWDALVSAATFDRMRARADRLVPDPVGLLRRPQAFFRSGISGAGAARLTPAELDRYHRRAAALAPPDLLAWLHRGW